VYRICSNSCFRTRSASESVGRSISKSNVLVSSVFTECFPCIRSIPSQINLSVLIAATHAHIEYTPNCSCVITACTPMTCRVCLELLCVLFTNICTAHECLLLCTVQFSTEPQSISSCSNENKKFDLLLKSILLLLLYTAAVLMTLAFVSYDKYHCVAVE
jgi:hypothetical protein